MSIHFITDSASDMIDNSREDVTFLPLTVTFGDTSYEDGVNLSHHQFYEKLVESDTLPVTSQVTPGAFEDVYRKVVEAGDEAIVITMSSKLSGTYQSACIAAEDFPGTVHVLDSENVTLGERCLVEYGLQLKDQGMGVEEILSELEREKKHIHVLGLLDTLEYLKKGGRISKTVALAGGLLSIKPVVTVKDGEVVLLGKARGSKQGHNLLTEQIEKSGGVDFDRPYFLGYTGLSDALLQKYIEDSSAIWKPHTDHLEVNTVGGAIGTHVGPGAVALAFFGQEKD